MYFVSNCRLPAFPFSRCRTKSCEIFFTNGPLLDRFVIPRQDRFLLLSARFINSAFHRAYSCNSSSSSRSNAHVCVHFIFCIYLFNQTAAIIIDFPCDKLGKRARKKENKDVRVARERRRVRMQKRKRIGRLFCCIVYIWGVLHDLPHRYQPREVFRRVRRPIVFHSRCLGMTLFRNEKWK